MFCEIPLDGSLHNHEFRPKSQYFPDNFLTFPLLMLLTVTSPSGSPLTLVAVSPSLIILSPTEKLVLEVRATGQYNFISWVRNGNAAGIGFPVSNTDNFAHFSEIYVNDMTTMDDLGKYQVDLPAGASGIPAAASIEFTVVAPGKSQYIIIHRHYTLFSCRWC